MAPSFEEVDTSFANPDELLGAKNLKSAKLNAKANGIHKGQLDASSISINITESPRDVPAVGDPIRSQHSVCTDHMVTARWTEAEGWERPELKAFGPLSLMPSCNVLQYATTCFEGMKLYRGYDGALRLFRPQRNADRMLISATRIALPPFPPEEFMKLVVKLCAVDGPKWLPRSQPGRMLYIRPTMIGDDPAMGVQKPKSALLYVIISLIPVMNENKEGVKLIASDEETSGVRAWPGGHGYAKVGANYGPTLLATSEAVAQGFTQVLWLLRRDTGKVEVTEAGASNFFVIWKTREGQTELVTAPLGERMILDGVTRRSVLQLAQERLTAKSTSRPENVAELQVAERAIEMREIEEAVEEGRLVEAFAAGTAYFVAPVSLIRYHGKNLHIPMVEGSTGTYAKTLRQWLSDIMYGKEQHEWGHIIEEEAEMKA